MYYTKGKVRHTCIHYSKVEGQPLYINYSKWNVRPHYTYSMGNVRLLYIYIYIIVIGNGGFFIYIIVLKVRPLYIYYSTVDGQPLYIRGSSSK
jgi:hypothetical protein